MVTLYGRIISLCEERGIKGGKLCTDLGMSKGTLTDLKMGRQTGLSASKAQKIADYFGVTVGYLLGKEEKTPTVTDGQKENPDQLVLTGIEAEMIKLFRQFPGVEQELLVIMMQNLYSVPADTRGPALETLQAFWKTIQKP